MADDKARIEASLAGVEGISAGQKKIADGWKPVEEAQANVSKGAKALDGAWKGLKTGIKSLASDALRATGILQGISLAKGVDEARAMQAATTRYAQKTGESASTLSTRLDGLEKRTLTSSPAMLSFSQALQAVTYDSSFATGSLGELGDIALSMGESLSDQLGFAETMRTGLGVTEKLTGEFDRLRGMAEELGISGGIQSFRDALVSANSELEHIADNGDKARAKVEAMAAVLTAGFKPGQQKSVLTGTLSMLRNRATDIERVTGKQVLNDRGELMDPADTLANLKRYSEARKKAKGWDDRTYRQAMRAEWGTDVAAAIMNYDPAKAAELAGKKNWSPETAQKADDLRNTPAGQNLARQLDRDQQLRHAGEVLLDASNKFFEVVGVWGALGTQLAAQLGGSMLGGAVKALGGVGAVAGGTAAAGVALAAAGVAANVLPLAEIGQDRDQMGADWRKKHAATFGAELAQKAIAAGDMNAVIGQVNGDKSVLEELLLALEKRQGEANDLLAQQIAAGIAAELHRAPMQVRLTKPANQADQ
jgi:hypothetical protein